MSVLNVTERSLLWNGLPGRLTTSLTSPLIRSTVSGRPWRSGPAMGRSCLRHRHSAAPRWTMPVWNSRGLLWLLTPSWRTISFLLPATWLLAVSGD
jgi:hypothetical protein